MDLQRFNAARVVGGGDPHEAADDKGHEEDHERYTHCARTLARRQVLVLPVRKLGAPPAVGKVGWPKGGAVRRGGVRRVVHILSSVRG